MAYRWERDLLKKILPLKLSTDGRVDQLAGEAALERHKRRSIAWLKKRISQHFTMAKDTETDRGKGIILPPNPKPFLGYLNVEVYHLVITYKSGSHRKMPNSHSVENELIFAIRKNIASENIVFRELLFTLIRAIQVRPIYTIESLSMISIY
jgi:hypothetical protein